MHDQIGCMSIMCYAFHWGGEGRHEPCAHGSVTEAALLASDVWQHSSSRDQCLCLLQAYDDLEHFETPFVAKLHRFTPLAEPQAVFTFHHPNKSEHIDNSRCCQLSFEASAHPGICHGFAGYFDAVLYKQVHLSILPSTHTPNMSSWFPIYFPIQQPVQLLADQPLELGVWRCGANHKVWYEWCVTYPQCSGIHNPNGRSYFVGL